MPSLLERVGRSLTRKKPEIITNNRDSVGTTLEGFQNVSPEDVKGYVPSSATSPSQEKSQGAFQSFLRAKSPSRNATAQPPKAPLLSLHLPELLETVSGGAREIVFEHQPDPSYTDEVVSAKRLSTAETLFLVQKTSSALAQKGLETPGIFKTFWHAQNPTAQRKLIIAFLQTLPINEQATVPAADTAAETTETTPALDTFNSLLHNTSPYDLAEVFKWAVRHFRHDGTPFGTSADEYGWYKTFAESEKTAGYPPDAYSTILAPLLLPAHLKLLNSIFQLASSVAAYGEINGVSGSKLSRSVGWWLLSERPHPTNGLVGFLQDWDTAARILEHLFLAYVRDQQRLGLMPKRLTQLVKAYPYPKQANPTTDAYYLPRPKFSTQRRTVIFIRAAVPRNAIDFYQGRPIQLLKDAIVAPPEDVSANADYRAIWDNFKRQATAENGPSEPASPVDLTQGAPVVSVTTLLSEIGLHTLTSASGESAKTSPVKAAGDLESSWARAFSLAGKKTSSVAGAESTNTTAPQSPMEWDDFTGTGFSGTLNDSTTLSFSDFAPPPSRQGSATVGGGTKSSRTSRMSSRQRRSMEFGQRPRTAAIANGHGAGLHKTEDTKTVPNKDASAIISDSAEPPLEIDETLIDGWAEILTDKAVASRTWPTFALYELRNPLTIPVAASSVNGDGTAEPNQIKWLAIETYVKPPPTREPSAPSSPTKGHKVKRSSSVGSGKRARFGFFSSTTSLTSKDKELGGKDEKKEKWKDHTRRASEISTDSVGAKSKDPASRSQADLSAPPAIAEEPEPTTPLKVVPEEKAIPDVATASKEAEVFPSKDSAPVASTLAPINTLPVPNTEGSRFVEGGTPGTIPESVTTEPGAPHHEDKSEVATIAVVGTSAAGIAAATAATALSKHGDDERNVPVSEDQTGTVDNTAVDIEVSAHPTAPAVHESQQGQSSAVPDQAIDSDAAALAQTHEDAQRKADEDAALESQRREAEMMAAKAQKEAEDLERQRVLKEQEELEAHRLREEAQAEALRVEAEQLEAARIEREQAELRAKQEQERIRLEIEEQARQDAAEKQAELDRLAALKAEEDRQAEIARLEAERVRLESEERARQDAAEKQAELDRLAALKAEEDRQAEIARLEAERIKLELEERARQEAAEKQAELDRLAALKAEEDRQAEIARQEAEELERQRVAKEAEELAAQKLLEEQRAEQLRLEAEALEAARIEREQQELLAQQEQERVRLEMEERARQEAAEKQAELDRLAALKAEEDRQAEIARLEAERIKLELEERARQEAAEKQAELDRLAALKAEEDRQAEIARQEAEELERQRVAKEAEELAAQKLLEEQRAEELRLEAEAEAARVEREQQELLAQQEQERVRLEMEERARQEAAEKQAEEDRLAALKAEEDRRAEIARQEAEELERQRVAKEAEELAAQKLLEEQKAEELRLEAEELERQRVARLAAEQAELDRIAAEEAENQRIADERAAEEARIAEAARLEEKRLEEARIAEQARLDEERRQAEIEQQRLDAEKAAAETEAETEAVPEPVVDTEKDDHPEGTVDVVPGDDQPATNEGDTVEDPEIIQEAPIEASATTDDAPVEESAKVDEPAA